MSGVSRPRAAGVLTPSAPVEATVPLLGSKLAVPEDPAHLIPRKRLHRALDGAMQTPVTVLSAPAGWGKTVLLSTWLRQNGWFAQARWISVEDGDDQRGVWQYLSAALAGRPEAVPAAPWGPVASRAFLSGLADELYQRTTPVLLIVDDGHQLRDPAVLDGLGFVLHHAGSRLRLVIASRTQPQLRLHGWRLRGEITELGAADLSLTVSETGALLAAHGHQLSAAAIEDVHQRTDGWPAAVSLAATAPPAHLAQEHHLLAYVRDDILQPQPQYLRRLLAETAVVDLMCASLIEALTGRRDAPAVLAELIRRNLVLATQHPTAPGQAWYRYPLLVREVLRADLDRNRGWLPGRLHERAAAWFAGRGWAVPARRHAQAAAAAVTPSRQLDGIEAGLPRQPLTERELAVLHYLPSVLSHGEIAAELSLSVNTVKTHVRHLYRKLQVTRRREAVRQGHERHLL